jgi:RNA polymerase sigma-70 factor, ECF subfamily
MNSPVAPNDIRRDLVALLPRLRRFAWTLTGDASVAETLVMDVCTGAIRKSHHWKGTARLESWIFSLIRTAWNDQSRTRGRPDDGHGASDDTGSGRTTSAHSALLCLPPGLASALLLIDVESFSYQEAATILGVPADLLAEQVCAARLHLSGMPPQKAERRA